MFFLRRVNKDEGRPSDFATRKSIGFERQERPFTELNPPTSMKYHHKMKEVSQAGDSCSAWAPSVACWRRDWHALMLLMSVVIPRGQRSWDGTG